MRVWKLDMEQVSDRHVSEPRELRKREEMLPLTDQEPEAVLRDIPDLNGQVRFPRCDDFTLMLPNVPNRDSDPAIGQPVVLGKADRRLDPELRFSGRVLDVDVDSRLLAREEEESEAALSKNGRTHRNSLHQSPCGWLGFPPVGVCQRVSYQSGKCDGQHALAHVDCTLMAQMPVKK